MGNPDEIARRLALLQGFGISPIDVDTIAKHIEENLRIIEELEKFGRGIRWTALQVQPPLKKV